MLSIRFQRHIIEARIALFIGNLLVVGIKDEGSIKANFEIVQGPHESLGWTSDIVAFPAEVAFSHLRSQNTYSINVHHEDGRLLLGDWISTLSCTSIPLYLVLIV
jgi:hypothetical protein